MKVYLSPSTQEWNMDVYGVTEETMMNYLADAIEPYLKANGIEYDRNSPAQTVSQVIAESNAGNYDLHLALHSNASPPATAGQARGPRAYYYTYSTTGARLAEIFNRNMRTIYPLPNLVGTFPTTSIAEVSRTKAPALLYEVAFHDNRADADWIHNNVQNIARVMARSITEFFGMPFVGVCTSGTTPASGYVYQGLIYAKVCNVSTVLNLRSQPNTQSTVLKQMQNGTEVVVLSGDTDGWVHVRLNDTTGYVSAQYLCICLPPEGGTRTGVVATQGGRLNIRSAPNLNALVLTSVPNGTRLTVTGEDGIFYRVSYNGYDGYAAKSYIQV